MGFCDRFWGCFGEFVANGGGCRILLGRKTGNSIVTHNYCLTFAAENKNKTVITFKIYDYENDGINPDVCSSLRQLCIGKLRISKELQENSEETFAISRQVPHANQSCISHVRDEECLRLPE